LQASAKRHKLDLTGTNFISRVAQRYGIAEKVRKGPAQTPPQQPKAVAQEAPPVIARTSVAAAPVVEEVAPARPKRVAKPKADLPDVDAL
jgi:hypothetical protein